MLLFVTPDGAQRRSGVQSRALGPCRRLWSPARLSVGRGDNWIIEKDIGFVRRRTSIRGPTLQGIVTTDLSLGACRRHVRPNRVPHPNREGNRHEYRHAAGRPVGPSPRRHLRRGMGRTRTARRLLPAGPPFRHDRPDLQSYHGARAGAGPSLPDQPVRPALFRDHGLQPGQDRSRRQPDRRPRRRASTRPVTSSMPASTAPGRTCRR